MNGKMKPLVQMVNDMGPFAEFVDKALAMGASIEEATQQYDWISTNEIWANDEYQINIDKHTAHGFPDFDIWHLSIKRRDKRPIHDWRDLQTIKNMLCGEDVEAIELYPAQARVVDTANQFHLWAFMADKERPGHKPRIPVGWTRGTIQDTNQATIMGAKQRRLPRDE